MKKPVLSYDVETGGGAWVDAGGYCLRTRTLGAGQLPLLLWKPVGHELRANDFHVMKGTGA